MELFNAPAGKYFFVDLFVNVIFLLWVGSASFFRKEGRYLVGIMVLGPFCWYLFMSREGSALCFIDSSQQYFNLRTRHAIIFN